MTIASIYEYDLDLPKRFSTAVIEPNKEELAAVELIKRRLEQRLKGQASDLIKEIEGEAKAVDPIDHSRDLSRRAFAFYLSVKNLYAEAEMVRKAALLGALNCEVADLDPDVNKGREGDNRIKDAMDQHTKLARENSGKPTWKTILTWIQAAEKDAGEGVEVVPTEVRADIAQKVADAEKASNKAKKDGASSKLQNKPE